VSWPTTTIADACSLVTDGTHYTPPDLGEGMPFLTVKDVTKNGNVDLTGCSRISKEEFERADKGNSVPKPGDVLFSKDGTVGKVHVVNGHQQFAVLSSLAILRPEHQKLDSNYFGWILKSESCLDQAIRNKTGSAIRRIILKDLKKVKFPLPPLSEQKRIAEILHRAESLRRQRRAALALLDELTQSIFLDMFGDPVSNPRRSDKLSTELSSAGWTRCTVGDQITLQRGKDITKNIARPGDVPVISSGGISFFHDEPFADGPGVLLGRKGSVGNVHYSAVDFWPHDTTLWVKDFKGNVPLYVYYFFKQFPISDYEASAANPSLNRNNLHPVAVDWPPVELQRQFAERFEAVEVHRSKFGTQFAELDQLFAALQHRAFRGEL
jgi:restriction endonuclease S subunit